MKHRITIPPPKAEAKSRVERKATKDLVLDVLGGLGLAGITEVVKDQQKQIDDLRGVNAALLERIRGGLTGSSGGADRKIYELIELFSEVLGGAEGGAPDLSGFNSGILTEEQSQALVYSVLAQTARQGGQNSAEGAAPHAWEDIRSVAARDGDDEEYPYGLDGVNVEDLDLDD